MGEFIELLASLICPRLKFLALLAYGRMFSVLINKLTLLLEVDCKSFSALFNPSLPLTLPQSQPWACAEFLFDSTNHHVSQTSSQLSMSLLINYCCLIRFSPLAFPSRPSPVVITRWSFDYQEFLLVSFPKLDHPFLSIVFAYLISFDLNDLLLLVNSLASRLMESDSLVLPTVLMITLYFYLRFHGAVPFVTTSEATAR